MLANPTMPKLDAEEQAQAMAHLREQFPRVSDHDLALFLRGDTPPAPQLPESVTDEKGLQDCLAHAEDLYKKAVEATDQIKLNWARVAAHAVAYATYFYATIWCRENN